MAPWGPQVESYLELLHGRNTFVLEIGEETLKSKLLQKARLDFFLNKKKWGEVGIFKKDINRSKSQRINLISHIFIEIGIL